MRSTDAGDEGNPARRPIFPCGPFKFHSILLEDGNLEQDLIECDDRLLLTASDELAPFEWLFDRLFSESEDLATSRTTEMILEYCLLSVISRGLICEYQLKAETPVITTASPHLELFQDITSTMPEKNK